MAVSRDHNETPRQEQNTTQQGGSSLLALPVEVLLEIIVYLECLDIESITLSCRFLYNIGEPSLIRHRNLKRIYWKFTYRDLPECKRYRSIEHPVQLFTAILDDPSTAAYVTHANIGYDTQTHGNNYSLTPYEASIERDTYAKYWATVNDQIENIMAYFEKYIALLETMNCWGSFIREVFVLHRGPILALLFATFYNLEHLAFQERGVLAPWLKIISTIAASNAQASDARRPFGKLHTLEIVGNSVDLQNIAPILDLPSLRLLRLIRGSGVCISSSSEKLAAAGSNITSLELSEWRLNRNALGALLSRIPNLQNFACHGVGLSPDYHFNHDNNRFWQPRQFLEVLSYYAGHSLCSLTLLGDHAASGSYRLSKDTILNSFVGSLRCFRILRYIRIDLSMFIDGPREIWSSDKGVRLPSIVDNDDDSEKAKIQKKIEKEEDGEGEEDYRWEWSGWGRELPPAWYLDVSDETHIVHPLINILPASTETLTIEMQLDQHIMQQLLRRLPERKECRLPNLKEISYECEERHSMLDMEEECATVGVKLTQKLKYGNFKYRRRDSLSDSDYSGCSEGDEGIVGWDDFEDYECSQYDDEYGSIYEDHREQILIEDEATLLQELGIEADGMIDEENTKVHEDIAAFEWLVSQAEQMMGIKAESRVEEVVGSKPPGRIMDNVAAESARQDGTSMSSYENLVLAQRRWQP